MTDPTPPAPTRAKRLRQKVYHDPAEAQRRYAKVLERRLSKARRAVIKGDKNWMLAVDTALGLRATDHERATADLFKKWMRSDPENVYSLLARLWGKRSRVDVGGFKEAVAGNVPVPFQDVLLAMLLGSKLPAGLRLDRPDDESEAALRETSRKSPGHNERSIPPRSSTAAAKTDGGGSPASIRQPDAIDIEPGQVKGSGGTASLIVPRQPVTAIEVGVASSSDRASIDGAGLRMTSRTVSIEAYVAEAFQSNPMAKPSTFERRETALVHRYVSWLTQLGHRPVRNEIRPPGCQRPLYTDLCDLSTGELVEAKASSSRLHIRMAIGQLLDYRRFVDHSRLAVLTPSRPDRDLLDLLNSLQIGSIYEVQRGVFDRVAP